MTDQSSTFNLYGMKVEAGHWTREMIDNSVIDVVERYDVSQYGLVFEKQAIAFHLQHAFDLVERTLPQIDLKQQRETFDRP